MKSFLAIVFTSLQNNLTISQSHNLAEEETTFNIMRLLFTFIAVLGPVRTYSLSPSLVDDQWHVVFAPCATSVRAYQSSDAFAKPIPFEADPDGGTFSISQRNISFVAGQGKQHKERMLALVVENEDRKAAEARIGVSLPTCRELHPRDPTICMLYDNEQPLSPLDTLSKGTFQRIIYEMHVSTFSSNGTFEGCIPYFGYLVKLGITTIQLMPVNSDIDSAWGYSTAHLFAIRSSIGGYRGLRRFIQAAHDAGLEVFIDVVYNHASARTLLHGIDRCEVDEDTKDSLPKTFCPSNNFKKKIPCSFGKYFYMDKNQVTPWGPRYNFSSKQVREYLMSNIKYWVEELGVDGLRFDSTVCIRKTQGTNGECWQADALDNSDGISFLRESTEYLSRTGRFSIAEDLQGDPVVTAKFSGNNNSSGLGFDARWDNGLSYLLHETLRKKDSKSVKALVEGISYRCSPESGSFISYTESHDIASAQTEGHARSASTVNDFVEDKKLLGRAKIIPVALALISCGTPMIFQGQEIGEMDSFSYSNPPKHDWNSLSTEWFKSKNDDQDTICYIAEEPKSEKLETYMTVSKLINIFSGAPSLNVEISQDDMPSTAFAFLRRNSKGKVISGIMNFHESSFKLATFKVPLPGVWSVTFGLEDGESTTTFQTTTLGEEHFISSLNVPGMATLLLQPSEEASNHKRKELDETEQCRKASFLGSMDSKHLKYFDQAYWRDHVFTDLYPFWNSTEALGSDKYGNFPTFRCNDGTTYDKIENPCQEIGTAPSWIANYADFDIAVQHSRQIFFYSVAFHMTGHSDMLQHARAGINVFFEKFANLDTGAICTYKSRVDNACLPPELVRNSMEHANALIGLAMYYYVARDEDVANFIYKSVDYAFDRWYRPDLFMMGMAEKTSTWPPPSVPVLEGEPLEKRKDMLAQLDQLNAYLMILRGLVVDSPKWKEKMLDLALALKKSFWDEKYNIMWGNANYKVLDSVHSDFGHSQKALWFIMMVAEHVEDFQLFKWAYTRAMRMIPLAWLPRRLYSNSTIGDIGTWAFDRTKQGISRSGHVWWVYAELSQTAAFLSLSNPSVASTVSSKAYNAYMELFLDNEAPQKGVHHWKDYKTGETLFGKAHIWKNGFHEAEHALVALFASAALSGEELELYFAPKRAVSGESNDENIIESATFYPGFFKGDVVRSVIVEDNKMPQDHIKTAVKWKKLRSTDHQPDPACLGVACSGNGICFEGECLCMHGWSGPKCDIDPCKDHIQISSSDENCGQCKVTFKLNPSTIYPHPVSTVMVAGSFSNWSAIEMNLDDYNQDVEDSAYTKLFPEDSFYRGMSSSRSYSLDLNIPRGQNHTYRFVLDQVLWTNDKCNPNAVADGMNDTNLNSLLYVSCPQSSTCKYADLTQYEEKLDENDTQHLTSDAVDSGAVVQLFEWTFESVAKECKRLGEEGWAAIQLSPVNAHLNLAPDVKENFDVGESPPPLYPWWQRYQPASYTIKSRSGNEAELRAVTKECALHGVQVWVELGMNSMNAAPCCDIPDSSEYPTCEGFFSDNFKSCAPERIFPSAGYDAGDLHSPPCGIGDVGTWGSPDVTWNCDMTGMPDLDTSSDHVQRILADYIDHLLDIGISGFRILAAGHMDSKDIQSIFMKSRNRIREDVFQMTKSRSRQPILINDLWPSWLIRYPHLQPDFYPDEMTPFRYNQISDNAYNTDIAFSFVAAESFYRNSSTSLRDLTELSTSTRFSHAMYKQKTDRIPLDKLILQVTNHFLTFYGVARCPENVEGTSDVKGVFHKDVCPSILSTVWDERLLTLGTIWMMTLPVGYTRVYSGYDWQRSYKINDFGQPFDKLYSSGPPRNFDGSTLDVICGSLPEDDISPAFVEDGTRFLCEHRHEGIAAMPKWRTEVARSNSYQLKVNECLDGKITSDHFVSISRSMRQGRNGPLRGGWVAINIDNQAVKKKFATRLPAGRYRNGSRGSRIEFFNVDSRGILETSLEPFDSIIIHTANMIQDDSTISATSAVIMLILWILIPMIACYVTLKKFNRDGDIVIRENASAALTENGDVLSFTEANNGDTNEETIVPETSTSAMICTLEHIAPETKISDRINQKVGGLGKVMEFVARFHPGPLVMVTPMVGSESYPAMREAESIDCIVDGKVETVRIFHYLWPSSEGYQKVESIFCKHDGIFGARSIKERDLYPSDERDMNYFISFFALWSQTVAKLVLRHRNQLDVLHLCDYHTAFAPSYIKSYGGSIPVLCTLHNASYQGSLIKHILEECPLAHVSRVAGIPREEIALKFTLDGDFNMLSGLISYFREEQNGHGFCAVSKNYAEEVPMLLDNFRVGQVHVKSLPNPELKFNRPTSLHGVKNIEELRIIKREKKIELQRNLDLNVDPDAMIAAFVGRLVAQKGIDAIADMATEMLLKHEKLQLVVVGPVGDVFGRYAEKRFENLTQNKIFKNRIFFRPTFFKFTSDYRLGCDVVLMPSRSEPFGFVDIEFAWAGCPCVGSLVGGLGKVPGWYFKLWKGGDFKYLRLQLSRTIDKVMEHGQKEVLKLGAEAICTSFPIINWQKKLDELYQNVIKNNSQPCTVSGSNFQSKENRLWEIPTDKDIFLVRLKNKYDAANFIAVEKKEELGNFSELYGNTSDDEDDQNLSITELTEFDNVDDDESEDVEGTLFENEDLEIGIQKEKPMNDSLNEKLGANIAHKLLTGKKTNIEKVFKSVIWEESHRKVSIQDITVSNMSSTSSSARKKMNLSIFCQKMLNKDIARRSVESWIIALLSILMPCHSTLLYAKSIAWAATYGWDDNQVGGIYAAHFVSFAVACLIWPQILQRFSIGLCISVSSLLHVISILYFIDASDGNYHVAILIAVATGLVSSANGPVFTAAMFFDELDGSLVSKMRNFGSIEGWRMILTGIFQGVIVYEFLDKPPEGQGSVYLSSSVIIWNIYAFFATLTLIGSTLLLLGMKKRLRTAVLPKVRLSSVLSYKAFSWLSMSSVLEGIISYPSLFLVSWLLLDGFNPGETSRWLMTSSIIIGFGIFGFAVLFAKFQEAPKCISVLATSFASPVPLQAIVMMAAPNLSADNVLGLLCITSFLIKLRGGLIAVLKLHVLQSRWKVVTFSCYELFLTNIASAASPFIIRRIANSMNLSLNAVGPGASPEAAAAAIFYIVSPVAFIILILQLTANRYAFLDISDIYTKVDWTGKK